MRRPNKFLYIVLNHLARLYTKLVKNHHFHNPHKVKIAEPSIIISNHTSFFDFLYVMWAARTKPVNFVVARKYYETKPLSRILKLANAIPKSLFQPDLSAVKSILTILDQKGIVSIFPEGQISATGITLPFPSGIGKLVKKSAVHVYSLKTTGAYLKDPPWTKTPRKGRIDSYLDLILSPEAIKNLSVEEIEKILYQAIYTNPYYEEYVNLFKGKNLARDLDKLLYICPNCQAEGKMHSDGDYLICEECKSNFLVTASGRLKLNNNEWTLAEAYQKQRDYEKKQILTKENYQFCLDVKVESIVDFKYAIVSKGILTITKDDIIYQSEDKYQFSMKSTNVRYVPFDNGRNFQIYRENMIYQFMPQKPYLCSKATNIIEVIYEINNP